MKGDAYCDKCVYRKILTCGLAYCSYLLDTERRRPCPPGEGCTVKVTRKVYRKRERTPEEKAAFAEKRREKERERKRLYYENNKQAVKERNKRWRTENKEWVNAYVRDRRKRLKEEENG